ncbi:MAG: hypothetical protein HY236_11580 [Acidobacteria bacterium]|nr:hypothetical protein [Acidobacteriota bacterium]
MSEPRIRNSELGSSRRRGAGQRVAGALLYPFFGLLLLVPLVRRWRRRPFWRYVRAGGWALGAALAAAGIWGPLGRLGALWAGFALLVLSTALGSLKDPEAARKQAERLGARHTLNGGFYGGRGLDLPARTPLWLFLTPEELLVVTQKKPDAVVRRYRLAGIEEILLEGESYRPCYVSFAKAPPQRDEKLTPGARCWLELTFQTEDAVPARLALEYRGAFARHLAEAAAHTLYQMRTLSAADRVGRQAPEILHVIGREHIAE